MGWPRLSLYLCSQFLHAVEHDPADGDQLVDAASVLTLWPEACLSPPRVPQRLRLLVVRHRRVDSAY